MRMMMKVKMDTEATSNAIADGSGPRLLQEHLARLQPEAAYFGPENGVRTAFIVFDLKDPSDIPSIAEPFFMGVGALIDMSPCMTVADVQVGLEKAAAAFAHA